MKTKINVMLAVIPALFFCCAGLGAGEAEIKYRSGSELVPVPVEQEFWEGEFIAGPATRVTADPGVDPALREYLAGIMDRAYPARGKNPVKPKNNILLRYTGEEFPEEGYRLTVTADTLLIEAAGRAGIFYGIQTFLQLMPAEIYGGEALDGLSAIPAQKINDYPRFGYRGVQLDVARTFMDKETVKKFIDRMSAHKLNTLHWHLADDEGWRIEIKSHPQLSEVGGFRGGDSPVQPIYGHWDRKYGGYYTQDEIREIVAYAEFRNITVIPEIDLPGHSRTAGKVYPHILCGVAEGTKVRYEDRRNVWCVAKENNYVILSDILAEVCELFPSEYIHVGGDEVGTGQWSSCPDCRAVMRRNGYSKPKQLEDYFVTRLTAILAGHGRKAGVWDEAAENGVLGKDNLVYGWQGVKQGLAVTGNGYKTVLMPGSYFYIDMKQAPDELGANWAAVVTTERLYSFDPENHGFGPDRMRNVAGIEAAFFSEIMTPYGTEYLDYMTYPRISALAETAWSQKDARNWDDFYGRLTRSHLDRLSAMGIAYRVFPPLTDYENSTITVREPFEGAQIRYTTDGTEPTMESPLYEGPIEDRHPEYYLFRAFYNGLASPAVFPTAKSTHTVPSDKTETFTFDLTEKVNAPGTWYVRVRASDSDNVKINRIWVASGSGTTNVLSGPWRINEAHISRFNATEANRTGTMSVTVNNTNSFPCEVTLELWPAQYIHPTVKLSSSMQAGERFPLSNAEDYNFTSYARTTKTPRKGDEITFTFTHPVEAESIDVRTGLSHMPRYHIPFGRVQVSTDGVRFTDAGELELGMAVIRPTEAVKAVRIISDSDGNSETAVAIQDLRIKPKRK